MAKLLATIKAVITRVVFACHGVVAIWQVAVFKRDNRYWYLAMPTLLLFAEGLFTLTIKENQEWKWFCPSVFIYLANVVPAIWLLELHKVDKRLQAREEQLNLTVTNGVDMLEINRMLGGKVQLPDIPVSTETWVTLIEQFLMLTLIVGRWLLPKGDLTRDQLSQLLLVYIGTAADIIEFFDSFKDDKIVSEPLLVLLTLAIWSWSLLQFTVVLTATKSRKSRVSTNGSLAKSTPTETCCCSIDVCAIMMNIVLQDAPFLIFRLLIIIHYRIVSYMNVFFTCKNTLVIVLQIYRLYVVHSETNKAKQVERVKGGRPSKGKKVRIASGNNIKAKPSKEDEPISCNIAIISNPKDITKLDSKKDIKLVALVVKRHDVLKELDIIKSWKENELKSSKIITEDDENDSIEDSENEAYDKRSKRKKRSSKRTKDDSADSDEDAADGDFDNQPSTSSDKGRRRKDNQRRTADAKKHKSKPGRDSLAELSEDSEGATRSGELVSE